MAMHESMPGTLIGDRTGNRSKAWACLATLLWVAGASAQLATLEDRAYFGINRPIPVRVSVPEAQPAPTEASEQVPVGEVRIDLFEPGKEQPISTAPVLPDAQVDLASLFPVLWAGPLPKVRYAQLVVGGEQVGSPLVLQPMVSEARAKLIEPKSRVVYFRDPATNQDNFNPRDGVLEWATEPPAYSGLRIYPDRLVVLTTSLGEMEFRLRPDAAPNSSWNFRELARQGFYTDVIFHRIVPTLASGHPFVVQVGDPTGSGDGGPGFSIDLEQSTLPHDFGVLSMARGDDPDTNGSQVFIALSREGTQRLDGKYTAFGELVRGEATLLALSKVPVKDQRPTDPPVLQRASLVDAPAYGKRPPRAQRPIEKPRR